MWRFLKKLEIELPYEPAIPLLGIHTEEARIERDTAWYTDSVDMNLGDELWEMVRDREAWHGAAHGVTKYWTQLSN